ncbi:hypothetical protein AB0P21_09685 [Kribbella sp. NPDC056861]|uniref:hypothetical protein n=1 Tax=Kribbella sp. NPDC056861 TaxID=3154857 RepID=UPI00341B9FD9
MFVDERITKLDRDSVAFVTTRQDQAMYYAWGAIDTLKRLDPEFGDWFSDDDVWNFGHAAFTGGITFRLGETTMLTSVQDLWDEFCRDKFGMFIVVTFISSED